MRVTAKDARKCANCGSKFADGKKRKRNAAGDLVCDKCHKAASRNLDVIEAVQDIIGVEAMRKLAHDSGDGQSIYHCPFCGSGAVIGRGDGTVECDYCQNCFTVQVQPKYPAMPQTNPLTGEPLDVPGMPGDRSTATTDDPASSVLNGEPVDHPDDPSQLNAQDKPSDPKSDSAKSDAPSGDDSKSGDDKKSDSKPSWLKGSSKLAADDDWTELAPGFFTYSPADGDAVAVVYPPGENPLVGSGGTDKIFWGVWLTAEERASDPHGLVDTVEAGKDAAEKALAQKIGARFITADGHVLDMDQMQRHLALRFADDPEFVLPDVRKAAEVLKGKTGPYCTKCSHYLPHAEGCPDATDKDLREQGLIR